MSEIVLLIFTICCLITNVIALCINVQQAIRIENKIKILKGLYDDET